MNKAESAEAQGKDNPPALQRAQGERVVVLRRRQVRGRYSTLSAMVPERSKWMLGPIVLVK